MDSKSVPKCGRPKQVLLELANDVTFFRGPSLYDRLAGRVQGREQGWACREKMEQKISWTGSPLRRARDPKQANRGVHVWIWMDSER